MKVFLADDEPLAREGLRLWLARETDVEIVGEAGDGPAAVAGLLATRPDVAFLDVQMPGCDGFEVLERIADTHLPLVVFETAWDEYALRAFEVAALDYLLKPIAEDKLRRAVERARRELERASAEPPERLLALLQARPGAEPARGHGRLVVRQGGRYLLLRPEEIEWAEAAANYVRLHARGSEFLLRSTLGGLLLRLGPARFARIHRRLIVNLDRVVEVVPLFHGEHEVSLHGGTRLPVSRGYRAALLGR